VITLKRRLVTWSRRATLAAGAATAVCMGAIATLQLGFWLFGKTWISFPVSRLFELASLNVSRHYALSSMDGPAQSRLDGQSVIEWSLDLPAVVALSVALAVFALLYAFLASVEKALAAHRPAEAAPPSTSA